MGQIKVSEKEVSIQTESLDSLREEFKDLSSKESAIRIVKLKYKSCCGCGCSTVDIKRTVPANSHLKDGDLVSTLEEDDDWA